MFAISSEIKENSTLARWFLKKNPDLSLDEKLFVQINEPGLLQEIFDVLFGYDTTSNRFKNSSSTTDEPDVSPDS